MSTVRMKVILVSQDTELYELCWTTLQQLGLEGPILEDPGRNPGNADLTIWDVSSTSPIPRRDESTGSLDLFIVSRQGLASVQRLLPNGVFGFLLKPVKRPVLQAFLLAALNSWSASENQTSGTKSLRSDREELFQALLEANIRLQECDQDRTNFLSRALHDFRTPLTAIEGYCEMLIGHGGEPLDPDRMDLLQRMRHSIGRLSRMSRAMFELSVRNNTERKPNLVKTSMDTCIRNGANQIIPIAQNRGIAVAIDLEHPETLLHLDPSAIEQVIVNILENACKFTPRHGSIEIRGRLTSMERPVHGADSDRTEHKTVPAYKVEVQDTGMGILPEHLESVFEEYTSYAGARDRSGGGLGLAICKMFITEHNGHIWAQSDRNGTTISFVLPLHQEIVTYLSPTGSEQRLAVGTN
jgi:two-component system, NarL family, sensor histidine kinase BarA